MLLYHTPLPRRNAATSYPSHSIANCQRSSALQREITYNRHPPATRLQSSFRPIVGPKAAFYELNHPSTGDSPHFVNFAHVTAILFQYLDASIYATRRSPYCPINLTSTPLPRKPFNRFDIVACMPGVEKCQTNICRISPKKNLPRAKPRDSPLECQRFRHTFCLLYERDIGLRNAILFVGKSIKRPNGMPDWNRPYMPVMDSLANINVRSCGTSQRQIGDRRSTRIFILFLRRIPPTCRLNIP